MLEDGSKKPDVRFDTRKFNQSVMLKQDSWRINDLYCIQLDRWGTNTLYHRLHVTFGPEPYRGGRVSGQPPLLFFVNTIRVVQRRNVRAVTQQSQSGGAMTGVVTHFGDRKTRL